MNGQTICKCYLSVFIENVSSSKSESHWLFIKIYGYFVENWYIDKSDFFRFFHFSKKYFPSYFSVYGKKYVTFGRASNARVVEVEAPTDAAWARGDLERDLRLLWLWLHTSPILFEHTDGGRSLDGTGSFFLSPTVTKKKKTVLQKKHIVENKMNNQASSTVRLEVLKINTYNYIFWLQIVLRKKWSLEVKVSFGRLSSLF